MEAYNICLAACLSNIILLKEWFGCEVSGRHSGSQELQFVVIEVNSIPGSLPTLSAVFMKQNFSAV